MASRIKGITIEIDGNTKALQTALKGVNGSLSDTKSALRDVDRLLKLDPGNTDLLAQKQRLLQEAIDGTAQKLNTLKEAERQAKAQMEAGTLGVDRYEALQREIVSTEQSLEKLKTQASVTDAGLKSSTGGFESLSNAASTAGDKISGISKAAGGLAAGAVATVPATQELRRDLSFLEQNAKDAGVGINATEKAFKTFNAVSGETDSSVEAVSNLLQAGFTESNLQLAVEGVSGAMSRFPDTLKIESLADSIQETIATGKSIGQFGEYLDRAGIGAVNFDTDLAKCSTTAERADLVLQALASSGANDTYNSWRKNNKALADYDDAMIDMQMALGDLAEAIAPLVTEFAEFGTKALDAFNDLPTAAKGVVGGLVGITAVAGPTLSGIGKVASGIDALTKSADGAGIASKGFSAAGKGIVSVLTKIPTPVAAAAGGVAFLTAAIYGAATSMNEETRAANEMSEAHDKNIASIEASAETAEIYADRLDVLTEKENKSAQDKTLIKSYVDSLNESIEGLNLTYDAEADKLSQSTDAIYSKIDAMKEEALQSAYIDQSKESLDKYTESQIKLTNAQDKLNAMQKEWDGLSQSEKQVRGELAKQINQQESKVNDLTNATSKYWQEYLRQANQAAMASGQWDTLVAEATAAGVKVPKSLVQGIKNGQYAIPTTVEELKALIKFDDLATNSALAGSKTVQNLSAQLASGEITAQEAAAKLTNAVDKQLNSGAAKAGGTGSKTGSDYAGGVSKQQGNAKSAGTTLSDAARQGAQSISLVSTGYNLGAGLASGLRNATGIVEVAANTLAAACDEVIRKKEQVSSPSKRWRDYFGLNMGKGLAEGLIKSIPEVKAAAAKVTSAADVSVLSGESMKVNGGIAKSSSAMVENINAGLDYDMIYKAMDAAVRNLNFTIVFDQREVGRGLRGMGVQFK